MLHGHEATRFGYFTLQWKSREKSSLDFLHLEEVRMIDTVVHMTLLILNLTYTRRSACIRSVLGKKRKTLTNY